MKRSLSETKRIDNSNKKEDVDVYAFTDDQDINKAKKHCLTKSSIPNNNPRMDNPFQFMKNSKNRVMFKHTFNGSDAVILSNNDICLKKKNCDNNTTTTRNFMEKSYGDSSTIIQGRSPQRVKENGEMSDHKNDVYYVVQGLRDTSINVKILSGAHLARKCIEPKFRHFCRIQDVFDLFLKHTKDLIETSPSMALVISTVLYLLSRDKEQFPYSDRAGEAILQLVKINNNIDDEEYNKTKEKIKVILDKWFENTNTNSSKQIKFQLTDDMLHPKNLALEALVFICISNGNSKFRDTIKSNGTLEWIIDEFGRIIDELLNILVTLTEENEISSAILGKTDGFLKKLCEVIFCWGPQNISEKYKFSITIACSGCLANVIESCGRNRKIILNEKCNYFDDEINDIQENTILVSFAKHFKYWESKITLIDEDMDNMLDIENDLDDDDTPISDEEKSKDGKSDIQGRSEMIKLRMEQKEKDCDALFTEAADKYATSHMEANLIASFSAINLGLLLQDNEELAEEVRKYLPNENFAPMINLLQRYLEFTSHINQSNSNACSKAINQIIENLGNFDSLR
ncbi:Wings apart-like protein homolog [Strongyloides ratti]|uniref:Wings apart-like protein homolog n=1 Tax=Strongyloides ratti TaxID=34506 RepID=A0A090LV35_STRRB|nr:Wings apart-like protein homolog [Strongyloides ratti]CEF71524.1 Wings apart-like protein homolog [Strongyloides ratti]